MNLKIESLLVLELCAGTLNDYCNGKYSGPNLNEADALHQMALGLNYLHSMNVTHGDVKTTNILIYVPEEPHLPNKLKISDFGLLKKLQEVPSVAKDVFSLGCVFYHFLTKESSQCEGTPDESSRFFPLIEDMVHSDAEVRPSMVRVVENLKTFQPESAFGEQIHQLLAIINKMSVIFNF